LIVKCQAYVEAGVQEAVLIDPQGQCYWVYTTDDMESPEARPDTEWWQSGALPDFRLCVTLITRPEDKNIEREYVQNVFGQKINK
jgi:Uma2 family endonuclease